MKYLFIVFTISTLFHSCQKKAKTEFASYEEYPVYEGSDLGVTYSSNSTLAKYWAPTATQVQMKLYKTGDGNTFIEEQSMQRKENGIWELELDGDRVGQYYTFQITFKGKTLNENPGPYAKAVGVNGKRAMIVDLASTNPADWGNDKRPELAGAEDIIIYEMHVRDMTIHNSSGVSIKGTFMGLAETGTSNTQGDKTGIDHLVELGVTHIHLLPSFDYRSVDETKLDQPQFNWGYDPVNYNVPEGSYSTDPFNAEVRIKEFKTMVQALHKNGIRVILDVVYNHTGETDESIFNQSVPNYYYRYKEDGTWSDAAACGNETASERKMMRKYMIESVAYWAKEYHLDGFRFDLMGIHDIETMNMLTAELHAIDPTLFVYGEGWTAGNSPLPDSVRALKANTKSLINVAAFSDDLRDGLKGSVFEEKDRGFASAQGGLEESIKFGIVASTQHDQVNYEKVNYSKAAWSPQPSQTINYVSCHDNNTLFDKLKLSVPNATEEEIIRMHKLSQTIVLTSQGIPFLHAGTEFLRTKQGIENSYNSPDSINQIDWERKNEYREVFDYYKDLIALRKAHPAFRMASTELIQNHLVFEEFEEDNLVGYTLKNNANGDSWSTIYVVFNGNTEEKSISIPEGTWKVVLENYKINEQGLREVNEEKLRLSGTSALILFQ
jgi:pullulanase